jgi:hypothetical protein
MTAAPIELPIESVKLALPHDCSSTRHELNATGSSCHQQSSGHASSPLALQSANAWTSNSS